MVVLFFMEVKKYTAMKRLISSACGSLQVWQELSRFPSYSLVLGLDLLANPKGVPRAIGCREK
jgi:hypothetical protein